MNIIKKTFDEIASRILMIVLGLLVIFIGLVSPMRCLYALSTIGDAEKKRNRCSTC